MKSFIANALIVKAALEGRLKVLIQPVRFPLKSPTHQLTVGEGEAAPSTHFAPYPPDSLICLREAWAETTFLHPSDENYGYIYRESDNGREWEKNDEAWRWNSPAAMPHKAARIYLKAGDPYTKRVQEVTEEEAIGYGIEFEYSEGRQYKNYHRQKGWTDFGHFVFSDYRDSFKGLFEQRHPESWQRNDWIWLTPVSVVSVTGKTD